MANTITAGTAGGGTLRTVDIHLEADKTKADATLDDSCHWLYAIKGMFHVQDEEGAVIPYDSLTAVQKRHVFLEAVI